MQANSPKSESASSGGPTGATTPESLLPQARNAAMVAAVRDQFDKMATISNNANTGSVPLNGPGSAPGKGAASINSSGGSKSAPQSQSSKPGDQLLGAPPSSVDEYLSSLDSVSDQAATLKRNVEIPATLEVLRKHDDFEQRRRSATLRVDSSISSSDSRRVSSFDRARHSGVTRLLRTNSSTLSGSSSTFHSANSHQGGLSTDQAVYDGIQDALANEGEGASTGNTNNNNTSASLQWSHVVLKMTSFSDDDLVTSFRFSDQGGSIGRDVSNAAAIPADKLLASSDHARIVYRQGRFYIVNGSPTNSGTFIRLTGLDADDEEDKMQWPLAQDTVFRAGKSDFYVTKFDEHAPLLEISAKSGKLNGQQFTITAQGAGIGRSAENMIHAGDGELSRKHCSIWFDELTSRFYLIDLNSTNGTFMKLSGPYNEPYRLEIGDDLLVSQTCLTVNRFDFGAFANMGARKQMEDAHTVIQDLNVASLSQLGLGLYPQSFFGVYDGHGGMEASAYLGEMLHHNILREFHAKRKLLVPDDGEEEEMEEVEEVEESSGPRNKNSKEAEMETVFGRIEENLTMAFQRTDDDFLSGSERPQAGSTATTVFIAGTQLFVANVGDSRTVLSRNGTAVRLSNDHKPNRPDEAQRIRETGGFVIHGRVMGELAVSRAFGDSPFKTFELPEPPNVDTKDGKASKPRSEYDSQELPVNPNEILKGPLVIATPEITRTELTDEDEFLLLASDGLYDVLKDQEAINFVRKKIVELGDVQRAVEATVVHAIVQQRSMDNVTAVVIMFKEPTDIATSIANASLPPSRVGSTSSVVVATPPVTVTAFPPPPPSTRG